MTQTFPPMLEAQDVSKRFAPTLSWGERLAARLGADVETRTVHAVEEVSLRVARGEALGLVGESGCGKSTLGRVLAGITPPTSGTALLDGAPVMRGGRKATTRVQTVFQDPASSLDPRMRIGAAVAEGPVAHGIIPRAGAAAYVREWLELVGLDPSYAARFPHQFSGGQRQRVAIARALAMKPDALVCDEPVAALDVSIQAQVINLFLDLRARLDLSMVFISHDLAVVRHLCERVAVMYLGRIVEEGPAGAVYARPAHPYTLALMQAVPKLEGGRATFHPIAGEIPSPLNPPTGCVFHPRCPRAEQRCRDERPALRHVAAGRQAACHFSELVMEAG